MNEKIIESESVDFEERCCAGSCMHRNTGRSFADYFFKERENIITWLEGIARAEFEGKLQSVPVTLGKFEESSNQIITLGDGITQIATVKSSIILRANAVVVVSAYAEASTRRSTAFKVSTPIL